MGKATELKTTTDIVKDILTHCPEARNSDDCLISIVCRKINPLCAGLSFETVMAHRKDLGLPAFETIRRTGQNIRRKHPELAGNSTVEGQRMLNEEVFREYARGNV